jgi:hypothetical protein
MHPTLSADLTPLVAAAIGATLPAGELAAGETEIRLGLEGSVGGRHWSSGLHGRLQVANRHHDPQALLDRVVALLLAGMSPAKRTAAIAKVVAAAAKTHDEDLDHLRDARKILRALRKRTGIEFVSTPTYKPKV